jgi:hypothetical protein
MRKLLIILNAMLKQRTPWHSPATVQASQARKLVPLKTTPLARKCDCAVMGQKEEAHDAKTAYGGTDGTCTFAL